MQDSCTCAEILLQTHNSVSCKRDPRGRYLRVFSDCLERQCFLPHFTARRSSVMKYDTQTYNYNCYATHRLSPAGNAHGHLVVGEGAQKHRTSASVSIDLCLTFSTIATEAHADLCIPRGVMSDDCSRQGTLNSVYTEDAPACVAWGKLGNN